MIRCAVPQENEAFFRVLLAQILHKNGCPRAIRILSWNNYQLSREWFNRAIIRLPLTKIGHWDFNPLRAWSPGIPTRIIPEQMALIDRQHHNRPCCNLCGVSAQEIDNRVYQGLLIGRPRIEAKAEVV